MPAPLFTTVPPLLTALTRVMVMVSPASGSVSLASTLKTVLEVFSFTVYASLTATGGSLALATVTVTVVVKWRRRRHVPCT